MQSLYYLTSVSAVKCPPLTVISPYYFHTMTHVNQELDHTVAI